MLGGLNVDKKRVGQLVEKIMVSCSMLHFLDLDNYSATPLAIDAIP